MSEESTTTIKAGEGFDAFWDVEKGTVAERKANIIEAAGLLPEHYENKTLYQVAADASLEASASFKGAKNATKQGFRPPTVADPGANEPQVQEPEYTGLAAFVVSAKSEKELDSLWANNEGNWTAELTQLAKKRKEELRAQ